MRKLIIKGYASVLPNKAIYFGQERRFRVSDQETQLDMAVAAAKKALEKAQLDMSEIDCIVSASAVGVQPIPSTAALIHEQIALEYHIPALDINTTCTSFITALDTMSYLIDAGRYQRVLIVASDVPSRGLNPNQEESFQLFSDGACAFIFEKAETPKGVLSSLQHTWSQGAHATEIRGGLTALPPYNYSEANKSDYQFDMKGKAILSLSAKKLPQMLEKFLEQSELSREDIDLVIPHQASRALGLMMKKLGFKEGQYLDLVSDYGNMVSASVPFGLAYALDHNLVKEGDTLALMGTAAGLTSNFLALTI